MTHHTEVMHDEVNKLERKLASARRTLEFLGYTDGGGEQWDPPRDIRPPEPEKMFVFDDIAIFALPPTAELDDLLKTRTFIDQLIEQVQRVRQ